MSSLSGKIPWKISEKGYKNLKKLCSSIKLIERNTGLPYPDVVVEPELKVLLHESQIEAVTHANIDFKRWNHRMSPIISVSLPLLIYGKKSLYSAVLFHEFLHYLFLSMKFLRADFFSLHLKFSNTTLGRLVFDESEQVSPKMVTKNHYLVNLVTKNFGKMINDQKLLSTIEVKWIKRNLPSIRLSSQSFAVRLSSSDFMTLYFPKAILNKTKQLLGQEVVGVAPLNP